VPASHGTGLGLGLAAAAAYGGASYATVLATVLFVAQAPAAWLPALFLAGGVAGALPRTALDTRGRAGAALGATLLLAIVCGRLGVAVLGPQPALLAALFLVAVVVARAAALPVEGRLRRHGPDQLASGRPGGPLLAGVAAAGAAGLLVEATVRLLGPIDALWVMALVVAAALLAARWTGRAGYADATDRVSSSPQRPSGTARGEATQPDAGAAALTRLVAASVAASVLLVAVGAYQWYAVLHQAFASDVIAAASAYGRLMAIAGAGAVLMQLAGRPLLARTGAAWGLAALPIAMLLTSAWTALAGARLVPVAFVRAADPFLHRTVGAAAVEALVAALPPGSGRRLRGTIDVVGAAVVMTWGAILLGLQAVGVAVPLEAWSYVLAGGALVTIGLAVAVSRRYRDALESSLARSRPRRARLDVADEASIRLLADAIRGGDASAAAQAVALLRRAPYPLWADVLEDVLTHESAAIRAEGLALVAESGDTRWAGAVMRAARDPDAAVRRAAVAALRATGGVEAVATLLGSLGDDDARVRAAAAVTVAAANDADARARAIATVRTMLSSERPEAREAATGSLPEVLGESHPSLTELLSGGLGDPDRRVRRAALRAAARAPDPTLVPSLEALLRDEALRREASAALLAHGPVAADRLRATVSDPNQEPQLRAAALALLPDADPTSAVVALAAAMIDAEGPVRAAAYRGLRATMTVLPATRIDRAIELESRLLAEAQLRLSAAQSGEAGALVVERLRAAATAARLRLALAAGLYSPDDRTLLSDPSGAPLSRAELELLGRTLPSALRAPVVTLLSGDAPATLALARRRFYLTPPALPELLRSLALGSEPWAQAAALHDIGRLRIAEGADAVRAALAAGSPLVRETALFAATRLFDEVEAGAAVERAADADPSDLVRGYARRVLHGAR
jgi:HEAT repeat protein